MKNPFARLALPTYCPGQRQSQRQKSLDLPRDDSLISNAKRLDSPTTENGGPANFGTHAPEPKRDPKRNPDPDPKPTGSISGKVRKAEGEVERPANPLPEDNSESESGARPGLFSLCTKCACEGKAHAENRSKSTCTYITRSDSYLSASAASRWEIGKHCGEKLSAPENLAQNGPVFDRSRFVPDVLLDGKVTIHDLFEIPMEQHLGKGSYGSVVRARDLRAQAWRAIKIVYKPKVENLCRLKREILIMKRLDHPNIIKLFEVYEDEKNLYLVMELCTGGELFERIIRPGHFSERYAASLMRQLFSAGAYCHANNVVHRDLKPENLLFVDYSPLAALKVIDWGFAARCGRHHSFSSVVGTPYYVAPEVLLGKYGSECDIWSAGVIMYILLCGYPPFHGKDNQSILKKVQAGNFSFDPKHWKHISDAAKDLVHRCLTYAPSRRITAKQALRHPWIVGFSGGTNGIDPPLSRRLGSDLIGRFKIFQRLNKLKRLAITCVAFQLTDSEIGLLGEAFQALDTNADGVLTISEVQQGLLHCGVSVENTLETLRELDTDGNGTIDYTEFIAACLDHKIYEQESACQSAFKVFDLDGDGKITVEELQKVLETSYMKDTFSKVAVIEMMQEGDLNNDGTIDFDEFMRMMRGRQRKFSDYKSTLARAQAIICRRASLRHRLADGESEKEAKQ